jgi:flagellar M-ring protein FliF
MVKKKKKSLEDIKARLKPKKTAITAEMLDTANSYDDKVAVIRILVGDDSSRVTAVLKQMIQRDLN